LNPTSAACFAGGMDSQREKEKMAMKTSAKRINIMTPY
jgi:hypothetical protein